MSKVEKFARIYKNLSPENQNYTLAFLKTLKCSQNDQIKKKLFDSSKIKEKKQNL